MKIQKSRNSRQPNKDYSSVCHQQGRMLTDSDLTEQALLVRDRLDSALRDVIGSGTPRNGGIAQVDASGALSLHYGRVYVDGVPGVVRNIDGGSEGNFDYFAQLQYPSPESVHAEREGLPEVPGLPDAFCLYLDVWERSVTWLEDEMLRDPGLHGADTTTRTQTMAQVKWCATEVDPMCADINPPIGDMALRLVLSDRKSAHDPCDPCSDELALNDPVGNYLFRVEVHDVAYDENDLPVEVVLKWSSENGAEAYRTADIPPDFENGAFLFEYFDATTEKYLGNHLCRDSGGARYVDGRRDDLVSDFNPASSQAREFVRRWDGWCRIARTGGDWQVTAGYEGKIDLTAGATAGSIGHVKQGGDAISIELDVITLTLTLGDNRVIAGDYWIAPVRESIHQTNSLLLGDSSSDAGEAPAGEMHHYMLLADVVDDVLMLPTGSECDAYDACSFTEFPSLTDLQATDVCYAQPDCSSPSMQSLLQEKVESLQGERIRLAALLDALMCRSSATTIPLDRQGDLCGLLKDPEVVTVQDALNLLCAHENEGCATITIAPSDGWYKALQQVGPGQDAHICFLEGNYPVPETIVLKSKGHLRISTAGEGSRFHHANNESVFTFEGCKSVTVDGGFFSSGTSGAGKPGDSTYDHLNGALTFIDCGEVSLRHVVLRCKEATRTFATCLTVRNTPEKPGRVCVRECRAEVGHQQIGFLLLDQERVTVDDNLVVVRKKPRHFTLDTMLKDFQVAARVRDLMIHDAVIRDFQKLEPDTRESLQNIQMSKSSGGRQVMLRSPIGGSHWKKAVESVTPARAYASNNELLAAVKETAIALLRDPELRAQHSVIERWIAGLEQQNPAVMRQGIVCAGSSTKEVRILNNTLNGVMMGVQVAVSDHSLPERDNFLVGRTRIEGNSMHVLLSPLADRRRGGIFVGNCSQLTIHDNSVRVQRYQATNKVRVESIRAYGIFGRKLIIKDNYCADCDVGVRITPLQVNEKLQNQWLVADNMFASSATAVEAPDIVMRRNNLT